MHYSRKTDISNGFLADGKTIASVSLEEFSASRQENQYQVAERETPLSRYAFSGRSVRRVSPSRRPLARPDVPCRAFKQNRRRLIFSKCCAP